jgi:hypothetical protein
MAEPSLELLQTMVQRVLDRLDQQGIGLREVSQRLITVEHQIAQVVATEASHYAGLSERLEHVATRIERIERRLDLVETP